MGARGGAHNARVRDGSREDWRVGGRVGDYQLLGELGRGGMGVVYLAEHAASGARYALKRLAAGADAEARLRFQREGQAQARADAHPNVVKVHALAEHAGCPFLVMAWVPGGDLKRRLAGGPLAPAEAVRVAGALAAGLAHAHARGVLHRDLKPANVLFGEGDAPKLVDFGLAHVAGAQTLTQTGTVMGTPAYMAPEQAAAAERVGPAADVYGLGAVLYELLTGYPPFSGGSALEILAAVAGREPAPPSRLRPGLDPALEALCLRCLAKDPADRFASAQALAAALAGVARGDPGAASRGRSARALALAAALLGAGLAAAVGALHIGGPSTTPARPAAARASASQRAAATLRLVVRLRQAHGPELAGLLQAAAADLGETPAALAQETAAYWRERLERAQSEGAAVELATDLGQFLGSELAASSPLATSVQGSLLATFAGGWTPAQGFARGMAAVRVEEALAYALTPAQGPSPGVRRLVEQVLRQGLAEDNRLAEWELWAAHPALLRASLRSGEFRDLRGGLYVVGEALRSLGKRERAAVLAFRPDSQPTRFCRLALNNHRLADAGELIELAELAAEVAAGRPPHVAPEYLAWADSARANALLTRALEEQGPTQRRLAAQATAAARLGLGRLTQPQAPRPLYNLLRSEATGLDVGGNPGPADDAFARAVERFEQRRARARAVAAGREADCLLALRRAWLERLRLRAAPREVVRLATAALAQARRDRREREDDALWIRGAALTARRQLEDWEAAERLLDGFEADLIAADASLAASAVAVARARGDAAAASARLQRALTAHPGDARLLELRAALQRAPR